MGEPRVGSASESAPEDAALLQAVIDNSQMGIAVLRLPDLVFELANPVFRAFAGGGEVVGRQVREVSPGLSEILSPLEKMADEVEEPWRREDQPFEVTDTPGVPPRTMYVTVEVRRLAVGAKEFLVVSVLDRTERVRLRQELEAEREQQQKASRVRLRFAEALDDINAVIHSSLHYDEIMRRALEEGTHALGGIAGAVFVGSGEYSEALYVYGFPQALLGRRFAASEFPFSRLMQEHKLPVAIGPSEMPSLMNPTVARIFGVRSIMAIPLVVRGTLVGGIGIVFGVPHEFSRTEIAFSAALGASISLALENADLYERQERLADTLQSALLTLPDRIPGLSFAHAYRSATQDARVGGDFVDVFELDNDAVGITVGDIAGHGVQAAVLTSLVKNAIRVEATQGNMRPDEVLAATNELLLANSPNDVFASVFFGVLHCETNIIEYCNAGHPSAVRICPQGDPLLLPSNSPVIGALPDQRFELSFERLESGETLFLYSDGLTEARADGEMFGEERLIDLLTRARMKNPKTMVKRALHEVLAFSHGELADDMAILALQRKPAGRAPR